LKVSLLQKFRQYINTAVQKPEFQRHQYQDYVQADYKYRNYVTHKCSKSLPDDGIEINIEKICYNIKLKGEPIKMKTLHNKSTENYK
jgi:hypothetical protein